MKLFLKILEPVSAAAAAAAAAAAVGPAYFKGENSDFVLERVGIVI